MFNSFRCLTSFNSFNTFYRMHAVDKFRSIHLYYCIDINCYYNSHHWHRLVKANVMWTKTKPKHADNGIIQLDNQARAEEANVKVLLLTAHAVLVATPHQFNYTDLKANMFVVYPMCMLVNFISLKDKKLHRR